MAKQDSHDASRRRGPRPGEQDSASGLHSLATHVSIGVPAREVQEPRPVQSAGGEGCVFTLHVGTPPAAMSEAPRATRVAGRASLLKRQLCGTRRRHGLSPNAPSASSRRLNFTSALETRNSSGLQLKTKSRQHKRTCTETCVRPCLPTPRSAS